MLSLPPEGFADQGNISIPIACDWLEANVLFSEEIVSISDVIDILNDNGIITDQDRAAEIVTDIWGHIAQRISWLGASSPFVIENAHIRRIKSWNEVPGHSLCLMLSLATYYKDWARDVGAEYIRQGYLFEKLTKESLEHHGWHVLQTGWSSGIQNNAFEQIVSDTATHLQELYINTPIVAIFNQAKEEGLDLVCDRPFRDGRGGKPTYLIQCASGANWPTKLGEPNTHVWTKLITFSVDPLPGFAIPFAIIENEKFFQTCARARGMLLDRYRILSVGHDTENWVPNDLRTSIEEWLGPRVESLTASLAEGSILLDNPTQTPHH